MERCCSSTLPIADRLITTVLPSLSCEMALAHCRACTTQVAGVAKRRTRRDRPGDERLSGRRQRAGMRAIKRARQRALSLTCACARSSAVRAGRSGAAHLAERRRPQHNVVVLSLRLLATAPHGARGSCSDTCVGGWVELRIGGGRAGYPARRNSRGSMQRQSAPSATQQQCMRRVREERGWVG